MVSDSHDPYETDGPQVRVPSPEQLLALFIPDSPKAGAWRVRLCRQRLPGPGPGDEAMALNSWEGSQAGGKNRSK